MQSVRQTHLWFRHERMPLPAVTYGAEGRRIDWKLPVYNTILHILTNPIYAGAYAFGRTGSRVSIEAGRKKIVRGFRRERKDWEVLIQNHAVVRAVVRLGTSATELCDGDPGLWKLQRQVMREATLVLDWFHIAMSFEHALQATRGLGAGTSSDNLRGAIQSANSRAPSGDPGTVVQAHVSGAWRA